MHILTAIKIVPDDHDIRSTNDGDLDFSKAGPVVSEYDLNALEASVQLVDKVGGSVDAITVGTTFIDSSKTKKNILARGTSELYMMAEDGLDDMDAHATAIALCDLVGNVDSYDLIVCGDGSADLNASQTGSQLAARLDLPYVAGVISMDTSEAGLVCERRLENSVETLEVPLPAVVAVLPEVASPRICGMKDILAAGKKPMHMETLSFKPTPALNVVSCKAPEKVERKLNVVSAGDENAIANFVAALKSAV